MAEPEKASASWEIWVGLLVAAGTVVTVGWAVFETYWG